MRDDSVDGGDDAREAEVMGTVPYRRWKGEKGEKAKKAGKGVCVSVFASWSYLLLLSFVARRLKSRVRRLLLLSLSRTFSKGKD